VHLLIDQLKVVLVHLWNLLLIAVLMLLLLSNKLHQAFVLGLRGSKLVVVLKDHLLMLELL
jgi:hypothetical protein